MLAALQCSASPMSKSVPQKRSTAAVLLGVRAVTLPNGWQLTPVGHTIGLAGDMPASMLLSSDHKNLFVSTAGFHDHSLNVYNIASGRIIQSVEVGKIWFGMAQDPDTGDVLVPGGGPATADFLTFLPADQQSAAKQAIHRFTYDGGKVAVTEGLPVPDVKGSKRWTSGIACAPGGLTYAIDTDASTVYELTGGNVAASVTVGYRPLSCTLSPGADYLAVTNWGDKSVSILRSSPFAEVTRIPVGSHPCAAVWTGKGAAQRLFVTNSGSNSVSVIAEVDGAWKVIETINTALTTNAPAGSTPLAVAASHDGKRLYVANADNNDVAVIDISDRDESRVLGFIPTGWYPSTVAVSPDDRQLFIGVGKGLSSRPNWPAKLNDGSTQPDGSGHRDYIGNVLSGGLTIVNLPDAPLLAKYSAQVVANVPHGFTQVGYNADAKLAFQQIKHVVYIIRENRTYDQVFGDIKSGNGDPNLVLFGEKVTPNAHNLAEKTVLLDNLFVNGEVSEDGHQWCNAAYATDFTEKAWENSYSGKGEPDADSRLTESPGGYLWDNCARHGLSYMSYEEFAEFTATPNSPPIFHGQGTLAGHSSPAFCAVGVFDNGRDVGRAGVFINDLHAAEKTGNWPNFMVMHLGEDHTRGLDPGVYSPSSNVADNDQALGKVVDAVSHSTFWNSTAIFVIEDDAQDGPDHVDCHRTVGLVISPFVKHNFVDHTHYTTTSMIKTMEMILKLPPMTQYDKYATPMTNCFTSKAVMDAFDNIDPKVSLIAKNPTTGPGATASAKLDFSDFDRADPQALNHILWDAIRPGTPMPAPVRSAWSGPVGTVIARAAGSKHVAGRHVL